MPFALGQQKCERVLPTAPDQQPPRDSIKTCTRFTMSQLQLQPRAGIHTGLVETTPNSLKGCSCYIKIDQNVTEPIHEPRTRLK
jgi:hypothetical protein